MGKFLTFVMEQSLPPLKHKSLGKKIVLLVANQRTGSTLTGQIIQKNPNTFYMFEPADAMYQAMYGTQPGLNVPTDIFFHPNGSKRVIPKFENKFLGDSLGSLLNCELKKLPTEVLSHPYLNTGHSYFGPSLTRLAPYIKCLRENCTKCTPRSNMCHKIIQGICPKSPNFSDEKQQMCRDILEFEESSKTSLTDLEITSVQSYSDCRFNVKQSILKNCFDLLQEVCEKSRIRAAKTVRISMKTVEYLIKKYKHKNIKVIHLIRDPRAVALSRGVEPVSMYGKFSGSDKIKEAYLYCQHVLHDIEARKRIESKNQGTVMTVVYEQLLKDPMKMASEIYSFIEEDMPKDVIKWISQKGGVVDKAIRGYDKWQDTFTYRTANSIMDNCSKLVQEIRDIHEWV